MEFAPDLLLIRPAPSTPGQGPEPQSQRYVLVDVCASPDAEPLASCELRWLDPERVAVVLISVPPPHRGLGLGDRLTHGMADRMRERGAQQLRGVGEDGTPFEIDL